MELGVSQPQPMTTSTDCDSSQPGHTSFPLRVIRSTLVRVSGLTCCVVYARALHHSSHAMAEQQITLTDLDPNQLQEVKKQLDEVS